VALRTVPRNSDIHIGTGPNKILAPLQDMVPPLLRPIVAIILLLIVKFVSSRLESIKPQLLMEMKAPIITVPLIMPLVVRPDTSGPFIAPSAGSSH
jgi:hypothetical protein